MSSRPSPEARLLHPLVQILGVDGERLSVRSLARGVTHETMLVRADDEPIAVLRLSPPSAGSLPRHDPTAEAALLRIIEGSDIPVPVVLAVDPDGMTFGRPGFLMSYCRGHSTLTWERLRADAGKATAVDALAILARLHALDVPAAWPDQNRGATHAERDLAGVVRLLETAGTAAPLEVRRAVDELATEPPAAALRHRIVHGDFRPANMMAADGRITGVLDWEMATVGDPACDFGISTMAEWGTWWSDAELLGRYVSLGGVPIEPRRLYWWRALGYAKVAAFLARRAADGWDGGPVLRPWLTALNGAVTAWRAS